MAEQELRFPKPAKWGEPVVTILQSRIAQRFVAGTGIVAVLASAGCGLQSAAPTPKAAGPVKPPASYLKVQAGQRRVALLVVAGQRTGGFDLNGTENGAMRFVVPVGWEATVTLRNQSRLRNSLAVVAGAGSTAPAFPQAGAPLHALATGIGEGRQASFRFRAERVGTYRLASLVKGHEASGMWATLVIVQGGRPSLVMGRAVHAGGARP